MLRKAVYKLGINRILKQIENDLRFGSESDVYFANKNDLAKTLVHLSIAN